MPSSLHVDSTTSESSVPSRRTQNSPLFFCVTCMCKNCFAVRLRGSSSPNKGFVEVKTPGHNWGGVCDDIAGDGMKNANVMCRMAGYSKGALNFVTQGAYGYGGSDFLLDDLGCTGNEDDVFDCPAKPVGDENCSYHEGFGVECKV